MRHGELVTCPKSHRYRMAELEYISRLTWCWSLSLQIYCLQAVRETIYCHPGNCVGWAPSGNRAHSHGVIEECLMKSLFKKVWAGLKANPQGQWNVPTIVTAGILFPSLGLRMGASKESGSSDPEKLKLLERVERPTFHESWPWVRKPTWADLPGKEPGTNNLTSSFSLQALPGL